MEPLEQIARDVRVIRRVIELLVIGALVVAGLVLLTQGDDESPRQRDDVGDQLCTEFPQLC